MTLWDTRIVTNFLLDTQAIVLVGWATVTARQNSITLQTGHTTFVIMMTVNGSAEVRGERT
jgi:hypothetical protein